MNTTLRLASLVLVLVVTTPLRAQQCGVPVGTVVAYMGNTVPEHWMIADGRPLGRNDFQALSDAVGTAHGAGYQGGNKVADFNLPDLRGQFLRGVDRSETGAPSGRDVATERSSAAPGGNTGMMVGTVQDAATQMPQTTPFSTAAAGQHDHGYTHTPVHRDRGTDGNFWHLGDHPGPARTTTDGQHTHTVTGGDRETRPTNVAVYWIICVR